MPDLIVYIDGFNLYHGLHDHSGRRHLWVDVVALARSLRPKSNLLEVQYFTAPVLDEPAAASRQGVYQSALLAQHPSSVKIIQGRYQKKMITCRNCGQSRAHYEEKETDVNIATALVSDAMNGRFEDALVVTADSDLVPAVKAVQANTTGLFIAAAFPPCRYSAHLKDLLPASIHIGPSKIVGAQLPDVVSDADGRTYSRPAKWA